MKFSFVLPAYKGQYFKEAIDSILSQDYQNFELIIVDDCSPDNLLDIVNGYNDTRISFYRNENNIGGTDLVAQWNHCLSFATGEYVILATDDDLYETDFLSSFIPMIEKYPDVALFRARVLQVDSQNEIKQIDNCYKEYLSSVEFCYHMMHGMKGGIPQYIFKREKLIESGGFVSFPKAWASDDATALILSEHGVVTSQEHLVRFRWSSINISSDKKCGLDKFRARLLFSAWLREHIIEPDCQEEWRIFYKKNIIEYLPIYLKITLISTMNMLTCKHWLYSIVVLIKNDSLDLKDKCSIILKSFQQRF